MTGSIVTQEELEQIDLFRDLRHRFIEIAGHQLFWKDKDADGLDLDDEGKRRLYYFLVLTRRFEQTAQTLFRQGKIPGSAYTARGNEATSVGTAFALRPQDTIAPLHRDVGSQLVRGLDPGVILAQLMGRVDGPTRGKDSAFHMGVADLNLIGMISHLGTMVPICVGAAFANRYLGQDSVALTYLGEGGASAGDFHEGLNYAAVHKLPFILVIDNNQWAYGTPPRLQYRTPIVALRAIGYGMAGYVVDGTDVLAVYDCCRRAVARARQGEGPTLIEAVTMRMEGHSEYDSYRDYVPKEELTRWETRDPVKQYETYLCDKGLLTPEGIAKVGQEVTSVLEEAVAFAQASKLPEPGEAAEGVYAT